MTDIVASQLRESITRVTGAVAMRVLQVGLAACQREIENVTRPNNEACQRGIWEDILFI